MKKTALSLVSVIILFAAAGLSPFGNNIYAQKNKSALKIGTYDSRTVIFAWSRADYLKQHMVKFGQQVDSAKKVNDTARVKELTIGIISFQHLLHQMVFSTGSVCSFMALIKDKLPELAKKEGVSMIVSKWELNYWDPSIEVVDLTNQVAALFQPKEDISKMAADIAGQPPVPAEELTIEADMLDGFCKMFDK